MPRYAVFLRGMNLGGRRITNAELCARIEALGFTDVEAFLASGNVVLSAREDGPESVADRVARGLEVALGYRVPTFVRNARQLRSIAGAEPFPQEIPDGPGGKLQVALLSRPASADERAGVLDLGSPEDALAFGTDELFWAPRLGVGRSTLEWKAIEKLLGPVTVRTHRTMARMVARFDWDSESPPLSSDA